MQHLAGDQPGHGVQAGVRVRADVQAVVLGDPDRAHVVGEAPRARRCAVPGGAAPGAPAPAPTRDSPALADLDAGCPGSPAASTTGASDGVHRSAHPRSMAPRVSAPGPAQVDAEGSGGAGQVGCERGRTISSDSGRSAGRALPRRPGPPAVRARPAVAPTAITTTGVNRGSTPNASAAARPVEPAQLVRRQALRLGLGDEVGDGLPGVVQPVRAGRCRSRRRSRRAPAAARWPGRPTAGCRPTACSPAARRRPRRAGSPRTARAGRC